MDTRIVYLMSGPAHLPYLVCSLRTLRRHWKGPVHVYAWEDSIEIVREIARDARLQIRPEFRWVEYRGKNAQFIDKIKLMMDLEGEADAAMYLDADTTVHGDPSPILWGCQEHEFVATQFCSWTTKKGTIAKRVRRLLDIDGIQNEPVQKTLELEWPSVNGGVFAVRPETGILALWHEWTWLARGVFIADETVLHVMQTMFSPDRFDTLLGGRWNCSPKFQPIAVKNEDVVVRHYHGDSNVRLNKSQRGIDLWWPIYQECRGENVGFIRDWEGRIKSKYLDKLKEHPCYRS